MGVGCDTNCGVTAARGCAYRVLVWQPERKEAWKTYRHGWEENIKMYLRDI